MTYLLKIGTNDSEIVTIFGGSVSTHSGGVDLSPMRPRPRVITGTHAKLGALTLQKKVPAKVSEVRAIISGLLPGVSPLRLVG